MKVFVKSLVLNALVGLILSLFAFFIVKYPIGKMLLIIGVFYLVFGAFGFISFIEENGMANIFVRLKNIDRIDSINSAHTSSYSGEVFSRYFSKKEYNRFSFISQILVGFILISLEYFFKSL